MSSEQYPISTAQMITVGVKEFLKAGAKRVPIAGEILNAHEAVFSTIEKNRVQRVLTELARRVADLEGLLKDPKKLAVVVFGCDQARGDILAEQKAKEYGGAISYMAQSDAVPGDVFEVLDNLRKLSANDLRVLYKFKQRTAILDSELVAHLAGWSEHQYPAMNVGPGSGTTQKLATDMAALFPALMRMLGLGVLYLAEPRRGWSGRVPPEVGELDTYLRQFAFLTPAGKRLIQALPGESA